MVRWHHQLDGQEFEQALGVGNGQGSPWCAAVHGAAKSQTRLSNWTELRLKLRVQFCEPQFIWSMTREKELQTMSGKHF